jgi:hypothetical protein
MSGGEQYVRAVGIEISTCRASRAGAYPAEIRAVDVHREDLITRRVWCSGRLKNKAGSVRREIRLGVFTLKRELADVSEVNFLIFAPGSRHSRRGRQNKHECHEHEGMADHKHECLGYRRLES